MFKINARMKVLGCFLIFVLFSASAWTFETINENLNPIIQEIRTLVDIRNNNHNEQNSIPIITIGGCPGVGKSTFATLLKDKLSGNDISSLIIHQDHYGISQAERRQFSNELDPRRIKWHQIHETLQSIKNRMRFIKKPVINQLTKEQAEETLDFLDIDCVIFEGAYVLANFRPMNFSEYADLAIYLETSLENIYDWKWERDQKKPNPRTEKQFFHHMEAILQDFAFHVYPSRSNADYIIQIDSYHHYSLINNPSDHPRLIPDFTHYRKEVLSYEEDSLKTN